MPLGCVPALLRMFVSLVVEVQRDLGVESDSKVVVHDTFLSVAVPFTIKVTINNRSVHHQYSRSIV